MKNNNALDLFSMEQELRASNYSNLEMESTGLVYFMELLVCQDMQKRLSNCPKSRINTFILILTECRLEINYSFDKPNQSLIILIITNFSRAMTSSDQMPGFILRKYVKIAFSDQHSLTLPIMIN